MFKILVVEDDEDLNAQICDYLKQSGFNPTGCLDANSAYNIMYDNAYDLIVSDIIMPGENGLQFAKNIRSQNTDIPIIFISAIDDFATKRKSFNLGVDDYMTKPIHLGELVLRINALLRRTKVSQNRHISVGDLVINYEERTVLYKGKEINLTAREFNLIFKMLSNPNKTFTRSQLMNEFWNMDNSQESRTVDVYMTKLRDKFSICSEFEIATVHGVGYKVVLK